MIMTDDGNSDDDSYRANIALLLLWMRRHGDTDPPRTISWSFTSSKEWGETHTILEIDDGVEETESEDEDSDSDGEDEENEFDDNKETLKGVKKK